MADNQTPSQAPSQQAPVVTKPKEKVIGKKAKPFGRSVLDIARLDDDETQTKDQKEETKGEAGSGSASRSEASLRDGNAAAHETPKEINESNPGSLTPAEKQKFKFKTKVNGVEREVELTEDDVRRHYSLSEASTQRFQESSQKDKRATETLAKLKDPTQLIKALQDLGYNPQELAENFLYDRLKFETMTPEQKRIYELEHKEYERDNAEKRRVQAEQEAQKSQVTDKLAKEIQADIIGALQTNKIPATSDNIWRMGHKMRSHLEKGVELTAKDAAELVYNDLVKEYRSLSGQLDVDKFIEILGQEAADKIRKRDLEKVKNPFQAAPSKESQPKAQVRKPAKSYKTEKDFQKHMERVYSEK